MRVLVTGGAGFLGSHLCEALVAEGHDVLALDNLCTGMVKNLERLSSEPRFSFEIFDITNPFDFGRVDYIFNLASAASPAEFERLGVETLKVGSLGVFNGLEVARRYGAKFLQASTSETYGDAQQHPQVETYWGNVNPIGPRSVYDESKRFAESTVVAYHRYYKVDTRIIRIFNTYGPRLRERDGRVISNLMMQALRGEDLTIYGDGKQTRSFCYVSDLLDGMMRLARSCETMPVNIGNPNEFTIEECAKQVLEVTGSKSRMRYFPLPEDDPKQRCPDITRARKLLNWEPTTDLRAGLQKSLRYFTSLLEQRSCDPHEVLSPASLS